MLLLQSTLRVAPGGLIMLGTPCSTHVWVSSGSTGKSRANPRGNMSLPAVAQGNAIANRAALLHLGCGLPQCLVGNGATRFLDPVFSGVFQEGPGVATPFGAPRKPPGQVASSLQLMRFT